MNIKGIFQTITIEHNNHVYFQVMLPLDSFLWPAYRADEATSSRAMIVLLRKCFGTSNQIVRDFLSEFLATFFLVVSFFFKDEERNLNTSV